MDIYSFDGCYELPVVSTDVSLNQKYFKRSVGSVKECEAIALKNDNDFFLVNDISNSVNSTYTNCYTPRIENKNSTVQDSLNFFKDLFFKSNGYLKQQETIELSNNFLYNQGKTDQKCFKYSVDEKVYAPKKYFAYYKKPIINDKYLETVALLNARSPSYYKNKLTELKSYESLIYLDPAFINNGSLTTSFKNFICNPTNRTNESDLDKEINNLKIKYENLYSNLDTISSDLSNLSYLNSFDDETIKSFNGRINTKNIELNSLLGSGGANNGRLDDTTFLTQFKIVENSILILIVISAIFIYSKTQNKIK